MADEEDPWAFGDDDTTAAATDETAAVGEDGAPAEEAPKVEKIKLDYSKFEKAPKPEYTLHWVRPLFLNYRYLYDYR